MKKNDVISYFGGVGKTAKALNISHASVSGWDEVIPKGRAFEIQALTKSYDNEHGQHDPDTGDFEFDNDAQRDYSATLEEIAEGIRTLHPSAGNSLTMSDSAPIYQVQYGNDWRDVERAQYDDHAAHGSPVRVVYTAPPMPGELIPTTSTDI